MYNGHKNWSHWNVSLWLGNDESSYRLCLEAKAKRPGNLKRQAAWLQAMLPARTPDGARYSLVALRAALDGLS